MDHEQLRQLIRDLIARELERGQRPAVPGLVSSPVAEQPAPVSPPAAAPAAPPGTVQFSGRVLTAGDLETLEPHTVLTIQPGTIVSMLAYEVAATRRILITLQPGPEKPSLALAADHGGYRLKEVVKGLLAEWGYPFFDYGTDSESPVDYPEYAHKVARAVSLHHHALGIVVDGAGSGSCMAANKVPGVRAAVCHSPDAAKNSREHNWANVLALGSRFLSAEACPEVLRTWLETPWGGGRHERRIKLLDGIERKYLRD